MFSLVAQVKVRPPKVKDPTGDLTKRVERLTGPNSIDCGRHVATRSLETGRAIYPERDLLQHSIDCIREAALQGKPAWTFLGQPGIDSWLADGFVTDRDGRLLQFSFISPVNPTGAGGDD